MNGRSNVHVPPGWSILDATTPEDLLLREPAIRDASLRREHATVEIKDVKGTVLAATEEERVRRGCLDAAALRFSSVSSGSTRGRGTNVMEVRMESDESRTGLPFSSRARSKTLSVSLASVVRALSAPL